MFLSVPGEGTTIPVEADGRTPGIQIPISRSVHG